MSEIEGKRRDCPTCGKELKILEKVPPQMFDAGGLRVSVPLAAWVYECDEHGRFVINIRGDVQVLG
jgi:hypothetical protein